VNKSVRFFTKGEQTSVWFLVEDEGFELQLLKILIGSNLASL